MKLTDVISRLDSTPESPALRFKAAVFDAITKHHCVKTRPRVSDVAEKGGKLYLRCSELPRLVAKPWRIKLIDDVTALCQAPDANPIGTQMNYDVGHAVHAWWQNQYLVHLGGDFALWGHWKCNRCQFVTLDIQRKPGDCEMCSGEPAWTYEEVTVREDTHRLTGHPDSLLGAAQPEIVNEIKTIGSDRFDKLTEPMEDHRVQVHAYMKATGLRRSMYCYIDKGKQSLWRMVDGDFEIYGEPRVKFFYEDFDDALWEKIAAVVTEFWSVVEALPK